MFQKRKGTLPFGNINRPRPFYVNISYYLEMC